MEDTARTQRINHTHQHWDGETNFEVGFDLLNPFDPAMGEDELRCILSHCDCQTLARMSSTCAWFYDIVSRTDLVSLWIDERVNALDTKFLGFHFQKKEVNLCEGIFNPIVDPVSIWGDFTRSMSIMNIPRNVYFLFHVYDIPVCVSNNTRWLGTILEFLQRKWKPSNYSDIIEYDIILKARKPYLFDLKTPANTQHNTKEQRNRGT